MALLLAGGCGTVGKSVRGIENFDQVGASSAALYRGAQPSAEGIETLREIGVKTVINLRDDPAAWEPDFVKAAGMAYISIPSSGHRVEEQRVREFLHAFRTAPRPIFVHCRVGRDRTGLAIAVWRMVEEGWTRQQAIRELREYGHQRLWLPAIERYLKHFDPQPYRGPA